MSMEVLQSQLFILRLIGSCLSVYWLKERTDLPSQQQSSSYPAVPPPGDDYPVIPERGQSNINSAEKLSLMPPAAINSGGGNSLFSINTSGSTSSSTVSASSTPSITHAATGISSSFNGSTVASSANLTDPPPFDDMLSKILLNSITRFFYTSSSTINPDFINHSFSSFSTGFYVDYTGAIPSSAASVSNSSVFTNLASFYINPQSENNSSTLGKLKSNNKNAAQDIRRAICSAILSLPSSMDVLPEIHKAAGRIMFYLSASNWPLVFSKIKARLINIVQTAQTGATDAPNHDREIGDLTELRFIEWCNLNKIRLGMIIAGIRESYY